MDKAKLKELGNLALKIVGGLSIVFVVIFLIVMIKPSLILEEEKTEDNSYEPVYDSTQRESSGSSYLEDDYSAYDDSSTSQIIKTGEISMTVDDLDDAMNEFNTIKEKFNGSIVYSAEGGEGVDKYLYITMKIKSSDFEKVFSEISDIEGNVENSYTNITDVTEQYIDLDSRLRNLEAVEVQLLEIMETAETVEDTLSVYTELSSTRSQIEVLKGEMRYLENQTDYSYVTVTFSLSSSGAEISEEEWKPLGVLKDAFRVFLLVLKGFANTLIWILVFSPIVLVGVGLYLLINKRHKKSSK